MIRFACPRCKSVLEASDNQAGSKIACPKCQQRLQIPMPPPNKTILAPLLENMPNHGIPQPNPPIDKPDPEYRSYPPVQSSRDLISGACSTPAPTASTVPTVPVTDRPRFGWPSRRFWFFLLALLPALAIMVLVIRFVSTGGYLRPAGQVAENRTSTRTDEEELVKNYILYNSETNADEVSFLTWGPHMDKQELHKLAEEGGISRMSEIYPIHSVKDDKLFLVLSGVFPGGQELDDVLRNFDGPIQQSAVKAIVRVRFKAKLKPDKNFGLLSIREKMSMLFEIFGDKTKDEIDALFFIYGKRVFPFIFFGHDDRKISDDWKQDLRKALSKRFPGIKR